ncbi:MAG TPA: pyridoxal phosphate-dependent aminotransferase [Polyangiales bacterium]|nr:pyridoxal phosphate-dependent aminotransferase [Polyangiales bacterium]
MFSQRSAFDRTLNRLEHARRVAAQTGRAVLDLTESNPTRAELPPARAALQALSYPDARHYDPDPLGLPSARAALSAWLHARGHDIPPEQIVLTASTSEAYAYVFKLLCDPGDDVLVPTPSYPLFEHLARLEAVHARGYRLHYDGRWHLPAGTLAPLVGPRTRAILTVHPNNPTGSCLKRDELAQLAATGLPIVSDEVFAPYLLAPDPDAVPSVLGARRANALGTGLGDGALSFVLNGLSKLAGLPQLKLAWLCVDGPLGPLREALSRLELIADSFLSVSTPVQLALPAILDAHAELTDAISARLRANLAHLRASLTGSPISALHVEAGWYALLRLPALLDDEAWAIALLEQHDVLVQPGYFYELQGGPYAVVSLLTIPDVFERGIERLRAAVLALTGDGS